MKVAVAILVATGITATTATAASTSVQIQQLQRRVDRHWAGIHRSATTLRFFKNHPKTLYWGGMKRHKHNWRIAMRKRALLSWHGRMVRQLTPQLEFLKRQNEGWTSRPDWMDPKWWQIGICESGSNPPNWHFNSGTFQGALGFYHGSWDAFRPAGFPSEAYLASPWQQVYVAERIRDRYGYSGWGCA